jgi:hypothetical protein
LIFVLPQDGDWIIVIRKLPDAVPQGLVLSIF